MGFDSVKLIIYIDSHGIHTSGKKGGYSKNITIIFLKKCPFVLFVRSRMFIFA